MKVTLLAMLLLPACQFEVAGLQPVAEMDAGPAPVVGQEPGTAETPPTGVSEKPMACAAACGAGCSACCNQTCSGDSCRCSIQGCQCNFLVEAGGTAMIECSHGSSCDIECTGAQSCKLACREGSHCRCAGATCAVSGCMPTQCPDGSQVCGRPCP